MAGQNYRTFCVPYRPLGGGDVVVQRVERLWTAMTLRPAFSRYGMTFCQHDPSANAPWTRTAVLAFSWAAEAGRPIAATAVRRRLKPTTPLYDFIATFLHLMGDLETQSPMFATTVVWAAYLVLRASWKLGSWLTRADAPSPCCDRRRRRSPATAASWSSRKKVRMRA